MYGRKVILEWAVAHGCPWDPAKCLRVAQINFAHEVVAFVEEWLSGPDVKEPGVD